MEKRRFPQMRGNFGSWRGPCEEHDSIRHAVACRRIEGDEAMIPPSPLPKNFLEHLETELLAMNLRTAMQCNIITPEQAIDALLTQWRKQYEQHNQ